MDIQASMPVDRNGRMVARDSFDIDTSQKPLKPVQLCLDMPVRWSSTFAMTLRAWERHPVGDFHLFLMLY